MKTFLLISVIVFFFSCDSQTGGKNMNIDEIGFNTLLAAKNNDKQKFYELFDQDLLANTSQGKLDSIFENSKSILDKYDFPKFETWKRDRFFYQVDTAKRIVDIGLPLSIVKNSTIDYVFEMQFSSKNKITGININKIPEAGIMPDTEFPPKEETFNYSLDSLLSIRLYYLPGINSNIKLSKSVEFTKEQFSDGIKNDFGNFLSEFNMSKIIDVQKTTSQQLNTNDLKAIIFVFKDNGKERNLYVLSNNIKEKPLEVNVFYIVNATYAYKLSDNNIAQLKTDINDLIKKYIK